MSKLVRTKKGLRSGCLTNWCSLEQSIRNDVHFLKGSKFVREELKERIKSFLYDINSGDM
jgi:hypothetical protein